MRHISNILIINIIKGHLQQRTIKEKMVLSDFKINSDLFCMYAPADYGVTLVYFAAVNRLSTLLSTER